MNPGIPVPPKLYGGIERVVYLLAEEYHNLGHDVTLLAGPDSFCSGKTVNFGFNAPKYSKMEIFNEFRFVWKYLIKNHNKFDLIHNFGRLAYFLPIAFTSVKKVMSYQRDVSVKGIKIISAMHPKNLLFTGCSNYCVSTGNVAGNWESVYNTIDFAQYTLNENVDKNAPLMFLGRLDKVKGAHTAIKIAKATNNILILAGNIPDTPDNFAYYKEEIEPQIDNVQIKYVGALNDTEKNKFLGQAKALLFPIEWGEPFGIVMIEAMACGTPVIAFKRGSVPEVVENGTTGFIVNTVDEMILSTGLIDTINRKKCRETAEALFNAPIIAKKYLDVVNTIN
jgi:glycosyltransferase involved in cell wall biosynthesis